MTITCTCLILLLCNTVGEPLTSEMQEWCYKVVGRENCLILDTWWQTGMYSNDIHVIIAVVTTVTYKTSCMFSLFFYTETGSIALTRWFAPEGKKPSHFPTKSSFPFLGVDPVLAEESLTYVCKFFT